MAVSDKRGARGDFDYLLWYADSVKYFDDAFVGHVRNEALSVVEQLEKAV